MFLSERHDPIEGRCRRFHFPGMPSVAVVRRVEDDECIVSRGNVLEDTGLTRYTVRTREFERDGLLPSVGTFAAALTEGGGFDSPHRRDFTTKFRVVNVKSEVMDAIRA